MSDDVWRRRSDDDDELDELVDVRFADDHPTAPVPETGPADEGPIAFGPNDTGPLPHWTDPPTGQIPAAGGAEAHDDVDVWSSFTGQSPVWRDDRSASDDSGGFEDLGFADESRPGALDERPAPDDLFFDLEDESAAPPRREPARISIGTDPTEDQSRPVRGRPARTDPMGRRPGSPPRAGRPPSQGARGPAPAPSTGRDLPTAVAAGVVLAAVFVGALMWKPVAVLALAVLIVGLAAVEFFDKVTEKGYRPATLVGLAACVSAPLVAYWIGDAALPLVIAFGFMAASISFIGAPGVQAGPLPNVAITMLGTVWIGLLGSYGVLVLRASNLGPAFENVGTDTLFILVVGVVANDVGAYFVGSGIGKTPLREWISPHKSVEGLIGGTIVTFLAVVLVGVQSDTWNDLSEWLLLALVISVLAPIGDLVESMFKRNLDVKDFGTIVRGHGGVLDRFDALLFVLPGVYYLMEVFEPWTS
jgi:phosphatidate cytidylyltransferase